MKKVLFTAALLVICVGVLAQTGNIQTIDQGSEPTVGGACVAPPTLTLRVKDTLDDYRCVSSVWVKATKISAPDDPTNYFWDMIIAEANSYGSFVMKPNSDYATLGIGYHTDYTRLGEGPMVNIRTGKGGAQLKLEYDNSNWVMFQVQSDGDFKITDTGNIGVGVEPTANAVQLADPVGIEDAVIQETGDRLIFTVPNNEYQFGDGAFVPDSAFNIDQEAGQSYFFSGTYEGDPVNNYIMRKLSNGRVYIDINRPGGAGNSQLGIGSGPVNATLDVFPNTHDVNQLALTFDASNLCTYSVDLNGEMTVDCTGQAVFFEHDLVVRGDITAQANVDGQEIARFNDVDQNAIVVFFDATGDVGGEVYFKDGADADKIRWSAPNHSYDISNGGVIFGSSDAPDARLELVNLSNPQLRMSNNTTNDHCDFTVDGNGDMTTDCDGDDWTFSDIPTITGLLGCDADNEKIGADGATGKLFCDSNPGGAAGDVTDVGPGCDTGACWTDTVTTTGQTLWVWEGVTSNANEYRWTFGTADPGFDYIINVAAPTAGRTVTFPDEGGTVCIGQTGSGCPTPGAGSGDEIEIEDGDDAGTFTAIDTTARFDDGGDVNFIFTDGGAGGPDVVTAQVKDFTIASEAQGDLLMRGATSWARLADSATANQSLVSGGAGGDPAWGWPYLWSLASPSPTDDGDCRWDNDDHYLACGTGSGFEPFYSGADACSASGGEFKLFYAQDTDAGASSAHCLLPKATVGCGNGEVVFVDNSSDNFECSSLFSFNGAGALHMASSATDLDFGCDAAGDCKLELTNNTGGDNLYFHSAGGPFIFDVCDGGTCDDTSNRHEFWDNVMIGKTSDVKQLWVTGELKCGPLGNSPCDMTSTSTSSASAFVFDAGEATHTGDLFEIQDEGTWKWMINDAGNMQMADGGRWFNANGLDESTYGAAWGDVVLVNASGTGVVTGINAMNLRLLGEFKGATTSSGTQRGLWVVQEFEPTGDNVDISDLIGAYYEVDDNSTGTGHTVNLIAQSNVVQTLGAGTTTVPKMTGNAIKLSYAGTNTTVTTARGVRIIAPTAPGAGTTVATQRGIDIEDLGGYGTNDSAIYIASQGGADALKGNVELAGGNWNTGHFEFNGAHCWSNGTTVYCKQGTPTGATDGTDLLDHFTTGDEINDLSVAVTWANVPDANVNGGDERDEVLVAAAGGDDLTCAAGVCDVDATVARLAGPAFTGDPTAPTPSAGDSDTSVATTDFVDRRTQHQCKTIESLVAADDNVFLDVFNGAVTITAVACNSQAAATVVLEDYGGTTIETIVCETDGAIAWDSTISGTATLTSGEVMQFDTTSASSPTWTMICYEWRND